MSQPLAPRCRLASWTLQPSRRFFFLNYSADTWKGGVGTPCLQATLHVLATLLQPVGLVKPHHETRPEFTGLHPHSTVEKKKSLQWQAVGVWYKDGYLLTLVSSENTRKTFNGGKGASPMER